ncbi:MAG TPA: ATP-dependent DNA helicase [Candidatus Faecimorpha stercoravium]|nr:ATP-dependent DNA helicase [Candidatus Faecimorpha stercoravium]
MAVVRSMEEEKRHTVSVRQMVEFICRAGDLSSGRFGDSLQRALEGTRVHQKLQKKRSGAYESEVPLKIQEVLSDGLTLQVEGRADGIEEYPEQDVPACIEEIKSTYAPADRLSFSFEPTHRGQLLCYGYMLCKLRSWERVRLRLTYYQMEAEEEHAFEEEWEFPALESFFHEILEEYAKWIRWQDAHLAERKESLQALAFPFPQYREGQRTMAAYIYRTIREEGGLFLQAPTGIGKTISALFPALKAMGQGLTSKIFYLTAKTATALSAQEALSKIEAQRPELLTVSLTAKDKICPFPESHCNPAECAYAKGHYDRVRDAVFTAIEKEKRMDRQRIQEYAKQFMVCPFELELDISTWSDVIIGDYNYAFDPTVSLKRFFQEGKSDYTLLVDEAHNLPDRAQRMFSAEVRIQDLEKLQRFFTGRPPSYQRRLRRRLGEILAWLTKRRESLRDGEMMTETAPSEEFCQLLQDLNLRLSEYLEEGEGEEWMELYFSLAFFLKMQEEYDDSSVTYLERREEDLIYHIFCIHPAKKLEATYQKVRAVILFSATLLPVEYYKELLGGNDPERPMEAIYLPSPFDPSHKKVLIETGIRTDYQNRGQTVGAVAAAIYRATQAKAGNYLVFFPSYSYLQQTAEFFQDAYPQIPLWVQEPGMGEEEREAYLGHFQEEEPWGIGFAVLGGMFSEGIDLRGRRLIGSIIVSVGLPQIGMERDLIRDYMDRLHGRGFDYAYRYPGLNKVFQAAGRVIRTEEDRGVILLIDHRYQEPRYIRNFPADWEPVWVSADRIGPVLAEFWKKQEWE